MSRRSVDAGATAGLIIMAASAVVTATAVVFLVRWIVRR